MGYPLPSRCRWDVAAFVAGSRSGYFLNPNSSWDWQSQPKGGTLLWDQDQDQYPYWVPTPHVRANLDHDSLGLLESVPTYFGTGVVEDSSQKGKLPESVGTRVCTHAHKKGFV